MRLTLASMVTEYDDDASRRTLANQLAVWVDEQAGAYPECISLVVQASSVAVEATIVLPRAAPNAAAMVRNCTSDSASCDGTLADLSIRLGVQVLSVQSSRRTVAFNAPSPPPPMLPLPHKAVDWLMELRLVNNQVLAALAGCLTLLGGGALYYRCCRRKSSPSRLERVGDLEAALQSELELRDSVRDSVRSPMAGLFEMGSPTSDSQGHSRRESRETSRDELWREPATRRADAGQHRIPSSGVAAVNAQPVRPPAGVQPSPLALKSLPRTRRVAPMLTPIQIDAKRAELFCHTRLPRTSTSTPSTSGQMPRRPRQPSTPGLQVIWEAVQASGAPVPLELHSLWAAVQGAAMPSAPLKVDAPISVLCEPTQAVDQPLSRPSIARADGSSLQVVHNEMEGPLEATDADVPATEASDDQGEERKALIEATDADAPATEASDDQGEEKEALIEATDADAPATEASDDQGEEKEEPLKATDADAPSPLAWGGAGWQPARLAVCQDSDDQAEEKADPPEATVGSADSGQRNIVAAHPPSKQDEEDHDQLPPDLQALWEAVLLAERR